MYFLCLCIYASLSPEMNSLGTVHDRRRWRNRGSVYPSQQQTVKRVKSAEQKIPRNLFAWSREAGVNRSEHERRPAFRVVSRTGNNPLLSTPYGITNIIILDGYVKFGRHGASSTICECLLRPIRKIHVSTSNMLNRSFLSS